MGLPEGATAEWLGRLFAATWPGLLSLVVYRARVPGPLLAWKDSFAVAAFCTALNYILLLPLTLIVLAGPTETTAVTYWAAAVAVFLIGPVMLPIAWSRVRNTSWMNRMFVAQYATAWDFYFLRRSPVFVLVHLKDGSRIGGYWGPGAYASLSPHAGDLYLSHVYQIDADGRLGDEVPLTDGALVSRGEYTHVELFKAPTPSPQ
jgi:hypothetical protein